MTKDIWHTSDEKPLIGIDMVVYYSKEYDELLVGYYNTEYEDFRPLDDFFCEEKTVKKWCYFDDLLALEHENAQLAHKVDVALAGLKYIQQNCLEYAADYMDKADEILEQITALEQKDVK